MSPLDRPPPLITKAWAATLATLLVATSPLWFPGRGVPRVAPSAVLATLPPGLDFVGLGLVAWGVLTTLLSRTPRRRGVAATLAGLLILTLPDELRWQAWTYHALVVGGVLASATQHRAIAALRWITIGVYAYSAIAKLDVEFADTLGQQLLIAIGIDVGDLSQSVRRTLALALPVAELVVATLLAASLRTKRLRGPAVTLALAQHAGTILLLGPWALGHGIGVLLWNVGFALQTSAIFTTDLSDQPASRRRPIGDVLAATLLLVALLSPIAYQFGYGDAWLNWALYAPRGERATVFVTPTALRTLPTSLRDYADPEVEGVHRLQLDGWVLRETRAPLSPQPRTAAAIAAALERRYALGDEISVVIDSRADRWTGERSTQTFAGRDELERMSAGRMAVWR